MPTAIIIVDHGSKRAESNAMLEEFVARFRSQSGYAIVEPAHMELASPSISEAFDRCVAQGARRIVVMPYFLSPGRHWTVDIPRLSAEAAANHPGIEHMVTAPIGLHPLMMQIVASRIDHCLAHALGEVGPCDVCENSDVECEMKGRAGDGPCGTGRPPL